MPALALNEGRFPTTTKQKGVAFGWIDDVGLSQTVPFLVDGGVTINLPVVGVAGFALFNLTWNISAIAGAPNGAIAFVPQRPRDGTDMAQRVIASGIVAAGERIDTWGSTGAGAKTGEIYFSFFIRLSNSAAAGNSLTVSRLDLMALAR